MTRLARQPAGFINRREGRHRATHFWRQVERQNAKSGTNLRLAAPHNLLSSTWRTSAERCRLSSASTLSASQFVSLPTTSSRCWRNAWSNRRQLYTTIKISNKKKKLPSPHLSSAHKRPAAALCRQGFISPKIDWVSQSKFSAVRSYCAPWVAK